MQLTWLRRPKWPTTSKRLLSWEAKNAAEAERDNKPKIESNEATEAAEADETDMDETKTNKADKADKANVAIKANDTNEATGASAVAEANDVQWGQFV